MTGSGMRSPEMRKKRRLRSVCAPHSRAAGTSIGPKLSFSMRMAAIPAAMLRANGGQVEEQHFGALARRELERALVGLERVARREALAVDADGAARDMHVRHAAGAELVARLLRAVEQAGIDARVLVHAHRALGAVGRGDEAQAAALVRGGEMLLLVLRRDAARLRLDPHLQEVRGAALVVVGLAVLHAASGAHALHVARHDGRTVAHRVLVRERAFEHVADDLHVSVAVRAEAGARLDAVLVDHAQRAVAHVPRVLIVGERKAVERAQPAVIGVAALAASPQLVHFCCWLACGWPACCWLATSACTLAMSSAFAWVMTCSSALPGSAPACCKRITFSRNTISVGMERMANEPASSGRASVSTLADTTSGWASAAFS